MYQVIGNEQSLKEWIEQSIFPATVIKDNPMVVKRLSEAVRTLDKYYGADRDLQKDMGGYTVIIYGTEKGITDSHRAVLTAHHLNEEEYEYEDIYSIPETGVKVIFRLYLCSNDYGIEEVIVEKKKTIKKVLI